MIAEFRVVPGSRMMYVYLSQQMFSDVDWHRISHAEVLNNMLLKISEVRSGILLID